MNDGPPSLQILFLKAWRHGGVLDRCHWNLLRRYGESKVLMPYPILLSSERCRTPGWIGREWPALNQVMSNRKAPRLFGDMLGLIWNMHHAFIWDITGLI